MRRIAGAFATGAGWYHTEETAQLVAAGLVEPCELKGRVPSYKLTKAGAAIVGEVKAEWVDDSRDGFRLLDVK